MRFVELFEKDIIKYILDTNAQVLLYIYAGCSQDLFKKIICNKRYLFF